MTDKIQGVDFNTIKTRTGLKVRQPIPRSERKLIIENMKIVNLEAENKDLAHKLSVDPTTEVSSRFDLNNKLHELNIDPNKEVSLLMIDIDYFKKINDTYGHLAGDYILEIVGERLKSKISKEDVVGRYGGEEFLIIFNKKIEPKVLFERAEEIRMAFDSKPVKYEDKTIDVTISIGIASRKKDETIFKSLDDADKALYQAKQNGRNRVILWENENNV